VLGVDPFLAATEGGVLAVFLEPVDDLLHPESPSFASRRRATCDLL
jgi:hypothetical protein